jgi:hypothetical protein
MRIRRLSRSERVRLASEKFKLAPQAVEAALNNIVAELNRQKSLGDIFGNKAQRKQIAILRDTTQKTLNIVKTAELPPVLRDTLSKHLGSVKGIVAVCDLILSHRRKPRRGDAGKRLALCGAHYLLPPTASEEEWLELASIIHGTPQHRRSFRLLLPKVLAHKDEEIERLENVASALTKTRNELQAGTKNRG